MRSSRFVMVSTRSPMLGRRRSSSRADRYVTRKSSPPPTSAGWRWSSPAAGTSGTELMPDRIRHWTLAALLAVAVLPYFVGLGDSAIWDANEAFYVETPREMIERGDYVSPTFNYEPRLNKPVLSYWIVGGFYRAFGVSVAVQRLAVACGAVGLIGTAFFLAW